MISIICSNCGKGKLHFNEYKTYETYYRIANFITNKDGDVLEETIPLYLIYVCEQCSKEFHLTYKEVETIMRNEIAKKVLRVKHIQYIKENFEVADIKESNTMIFCGECEGFESGKCPDRFFNRCVIRKKAYGIQLS